MQRFYCTVCKKVKRVQHIPANVETPNAERPEDRIGVCRRHSGERLNYKPEYRKAAGGR